MQPIWSIENAPSNYEEFKANMIIQCDTINSALDIIKSALELQTSQLKQQLDDIKQQMFPLINPPKLVSSVVLDNSFYQLLSKIDSMKGEISLFMNSIANDIY